MHTHRNTLNTWVYGTQFKNKNKINKIREHQRPREDLRRRKVAPESEGPIGVGNRHVVLLVGGTDRRLLIDPLLLRLLLQSDIVYRSRPHRRHREEQMRNPIVSGLSSRVGSHRMEAVEPLEVMQSGGVPGHGTKTRMGNEHFHLCRVFRRQNR
jgi:hypothetical protein